MIKIIKLPASKDEDNQRSCLKYRRFGQPLVTTYIQAHQQRKEVQSDSDGAARRRERRFYGKRRSCSGGDGQPPALNKEWDASAGKRESCASGNELRHAGRFKENE
ncbi:hypothetical protein PoB_006660800 [Plakobranchus ocellatus]|uniref:Uncharacterized protein n=1 Tax=Plakobranchus ocellatus TaxID=259542 RepID=A0AAV4D7S0_9GAST|nr:hypothetical protein PoB_006660800 [Plakobranchus ocellatus]